MYCTCQQAKDKPPPIPKLFRGGFPGIPLAILFPEVQFHLVDSIGKKVKVATEIANAIGLKNVTVYSAEEKEILSW